DETRPPEIKVIESTADIITNNGLPVVACLSLCLTMLCAGILSKPIFKGSFYKYLLYISIFDSLTLFTILFRPLLKQTLTEDIHELYFYCFITSFSLTSSYIIKLIISLDRYSRMSLKLTYLMRRPSNTILRLCLILSVIISSPVFLFHDYLEFEWYKLTYFELSLSKTGNTSPLGSFILLNIIVFNLGIYFLLIYFNVLLGKTIKENFKKLQQAIEIEQKRSKDFIINIEGDDLNEEETRVKLRDVCSFESNSIKKSPIEIEKCRKKLCDMIIFSNYVYLIGHTLNMILSISEQFKNLFGFKNFQLKTGKISDEMDITAPVLALSNIVLYSSMGINFFVFFFFSVNFRFVVEKAFKQTFRCLFCVSCMPCTMDKPIDKNDKDNILKLI
ncbi:unnamed protein product, partial [Brachionus calyciflorus]